MRFKTDDYEYEKYRRDDDGCSHCGGSRQIDGKQCPACDGRGFEPGWDEEDD